MKHNDFDIIFNLFCIKVQTLHTTLTDPDKYSSKCVSKKKTKNMPYEKLSFLFHLHTDIHFHNFIECK